MFFVFLGIIKDFMDFKVFRVKTISVPLRELRGEATPRLV